jgi:hypothetical protein
MEQGTTVHGRDGGLRRRRPAAASDAKRQHEVSIITPKTEDSNITMQFLDETIASVAGTSDLQSILKDHVTIPR